MVGQMNPYILLIAPLAPLAGAAIAGLLGTRFFGNRVGRAVSTVAAILGVLIAFAVSVYALLAVNRGETFDGALYTWMTVGTLRFEVGFQIDSLSALMMCVVTFVSLMVHVYTVGYMHDDPGYNRFFAYISLFTFAMLMLVMSNNFLQLFFGWEAVGLVSYLLIGFWFEKESATQAGLKAFLVNRIGDFGFLLGIGLLLAYAGSLDYSEVFAQREALAAMTLPGTGWALLTVACICLFVGAMGKSAQFPLHVWLPDSMEGPTPISALIHAATMVTAGIFMVARMSPLFELSDTALSFMLVIGAITALFMGLVGMVQNDIKRVIAYSTLSQLGYMTVALGASAYSAALFHLTTHAFFKALLFLAAGSVIVAMHHDQDIRNMGGLRKYMPITAVTALTGSLALAGTPFLSGFYSKESIVEAARLSTLAGSNFAYFAVLAGVFVTAFYTFRLYFLVFHGKERYERVHPPKFSDEEAEENGIGRMEEHVGLPPGEKPHESPWTMTLPLILLAIPSVAIGYFTIAPVLFGSFFDNVIVVNDALHPAMDELEAAFVSPLAMGLHGLIALPTWLALAGFATAYWFYKIKPEIPAKLRSSMSATHKLLENKYYLDELNQKVFVAGSRKLGAGLWKLGDMRLIDGLIVNGSARAVGWFAALIRQFQTGHLYHYAFVMILSLLGLLIWFMHFASPR